MFGAGRSRSDELLLDLFLNCLKPTFGAGRPVSEEFDLGLQLTYSLFGGSELHRKLMRQFHGAVAVFIRPSGFNPNERTLRCYEIARVIANVRFTSVSSTNRRNTF